MENWQENYFMVPSEWDKPYFKELIGGMKCSKEEKEKYIQQMKEAIKRNNHGIKNVLNKEILLKAYPESLDLLGDYYKSLNYSFRGKKDFNKDKYTMLMIYTPYLSSLSLNQLKQHMDKLNIDFNEMQKIIILYKKKFSNNEENQNDLISNKRYDLSLLIQLMEEFTISNLNVTEFSKEYKLSSGAFARYTERIKEHNLDLYNKVKQQVANPDEKKWNFNYSMKKNIWETEMFQKLIGGIKCAEEEKKECLKRINDAINTNNSGTIVKLDKEILLKSYPESIELLNSYYNSLINAYQKENNRLHLNNNLKWKTELITDRNTMLFLYIPYLSSLPLDKLEKYMKTFQLSMKQMNNMIMKYKESHSEKISKELIEDKKYDLNILKQIVKDILENHYTKSTIEKKYNMSGYTFNEMIEQLKIIDPTANDAIAKELQLNSVAYFQQMEKLIPKLYEYIANGIQIENKTIPFTMLDFHCISKKNTHDIIAYLNKNKINTNIPHCKNTIINFLNSSKNVGPFVSAESLAKKNLSITIKDKSLDLDLDFCTKIIDYLKENKIPINYNIVYTAARRYANGVEILPLLSIEKRKTQETSNTQNTEIKSLK